MSVPITIVTVCLNAAVHIEETILSVLNQNYDNLEYIIVDGVSTDGTLDIIKKYEDRISTWISEPDKGISDAFNKGIKLAHGYIIGIVSADDYLMPGSLEALNAALQVNPNADVYFGNALFIEPYNNFSYIQKPDIDFKSIWHRQPLKHASTFVKREAYSRLGNFCNAKYAMDYELILRFYVKDAKFQYVDKTLAAFRFGGLSWKHVNATMQEVRDFSISYGFPAWKAYAYYVSKILRLRIRRLLIDLKLTSLLNLYRQSSRRWVRTESKES